jgi:hypothetical protein
MSSTRPLPLNVVLTHSLPFTRPPGFLIYVARFPSAPLIEQKCGPHIEHQPLLELRPDESSFARTPIIAEKLRRGETAGQAIARRKVMGAAVSPTTMTDSLHSHNSNPRNRVKGFASRGLVGLS